MLSNLWPPQLASLRREDSRQKKIHRNNMSIVYGDFSYNNKLDHS
jgi:hypothetical protein